MNKFALEKQRSKIMVDKLRPPQKQHKINNIFQAIHTRLNSFVMRGGLHHDLVKDSIAEDVERSRKSLNHCLT